MRFVVKVILFFGVALVPSLSADAPKEKSVAGMDLTKVPKFFYAHVPKLADGQGLLIEKVAADSLGERMGFLQHDILLSIGDIDLKDADHFGRLLLALGDNNTKVTVFRKGQKMSLAFKVRLEDLPKGLVKQGGLPDVTIKAQADGNNGHILNLRFYAEGTGKLEEIILKGSLGKIENEVRDLAAKNRMSTRVQQFVETALGRLRTINKSK